MYKKVTEEGPYMVSWFDEQSDPCFPFHPCSQAEYADS